MTATRAVVRPPRDAQAPRNQAPRNPQAAPTRDRVTATAAGRTPGTAAPGPRRTAPTTRTRAEVLTATTVAPTARRPAPTTRTGTRAATTATAAPDRAAPATRRASATTATANRVAPATRRASRASTAAPDRVPATRPVAATRASAGTSAAPRRATSSRTTTTAPADAPTGAAATARPLPLTAPQPRTTPTRRTPLRIVGPPATEATSRRRRRLWVGAFIGLACAGLFAIVGVRVLLAQGQGPLDTLESQVTAAQAENQRLRLDVARLESPSRIVAEAKSRLGMITPAAVVYLPPLPPVSLTEAQPPAPAG